jgi:hypothetical protein
MKGSMKSNDLNLKQDKQPIGVAVRLPGAVSDYPGREKRPRIKHTSLKFIVPMLIR